MLKIRTSILAIYNDCPRRGMLRISKERANQDFICRQGYKMGSKVRGIYTAIGQGLHVGAAQIAVALKVTHERGSLQHSQEQAIIKFKNDISGGVEFDNITQSANEGEQQVLQLVKSYYHEIAPKIKPALIEELLEGTIDGVLLTGHPDLITKEAAVRDSKTGRESNASAQLGGYSLLGKSNNYVIDHAFIDYLPRTPLKKVYPGARIIPYNIKECKMTAWYTVKRIKADHELFLKTENPNVIPANPLSIFCSPKWCEAANTDFCKLCMK